jgi:hypothetical protein
VNYRLLYREPGKRPGITRWAKRPVASVTEAKEWMNANPDKAFLPAFVETPGNRYQKPETVAILGEDKP